MNLVQFTSDSKMARKLFSSMREDPQSLLALGRRKNPETPLHRFTQMHKRAANKYPNLFIFRREDLKAALRERFHSKCPSKQNATSKLCSLLIYCNFLVSVIPVSTPPPKYGCTVADHVPTAFPCFILNWELDFFQLLRITGGEIGCHGLGICLIPKSGG